MSAWWIVPRISQTGARNGVQKRVIEPVETLNNDNATNSTSEGLSDAKLQKWSEMRVHNMQDEMDTINIVDRM